MLRERVFPSIHLLRPLACVLGAGLLVASSTQAAQLTQTIGYDPIKREYDPTEYYRTGMDLSLKNAAVYVPFAFDFDGGLYSLDSIQLLLISSGHPSFMSILATSTLGTDLTVPPLLATFSFDGVVSDSPAFKFDADSPSLLTSGSTYYLRMTYEGPGDFQWVWSEWLPGVPPSQGSNPNTSGGGSSGALSRTDPDNFTYRIVGPNFYRDESGVYGISITATAVPEPTTFAMAVGGLTLGAGLLFRLRRRR